ncbi:WGR domain-containing protein [Rubellimicrobium arenae]|uniref:WGR domain-containing protein n=1 Tax=Rubellimicrobium arenae TaxID=2817372 RepID=UPI001B30F315|nr:WGR domain-containing protein [Rubellimicrobium arenae]
MDVRLPCIDPARNRFRAYGLSVGPDLFGDWVLVASWGQIGRPGRMRVVCPGEKGAVRACAEQLLRLRARQGCIVVGRGPGLMPGRAGTDGHLGARPFANHGRRQAHR